MSLPARTHGLMERSLAVFSGWQVGPTARQTELQRRGLFGSLSSVRGAELGEVEMSTLAWICQEWWEHGSPKNGVVRFTWYRLGRDLWPEKHDSGSRYREMAQQAVDNLMAAIVTLGGFSVHNGEWSNELASDVHILRTIVRNRGKNPNPTLDGGLREDTVEVRLEDWLMAQLLGDVGFFADWEVERSLGGAAKRLWYYLGGRADAFSAGAFPGEEVCTLRVDADLFDSLDLNAQRPSSNRATVKRAGQRIESVDPRYSRVVIEKDPDERGAFRLRAVRKTADAVAAELVAAA